MQDMDEGKTVVHKARTLKFRNCGPPFPLHMHVFSLLPLPQVRA